MVPAHGGNLTEKEKPRGSKKGQEDNEGTQARKEARHGQAPVENNERARWEHRIEPTTPASLKLPSRNASSDVVTSYHRGRDVSVSVPEAGTRLTACRG